MHFAIALLLLVMMGVILPTVIALLYAHGEREQNDRPEPPKRDL